MAGMQPFAQLQGGISPFVGMCQSGSLTIHSIGDCEAAPGRIEKDELQAAPALVEQMQCISVSSNSAVIASQIADSLLCKCTAKAVSSKAAGCGSI